MLADKDTTLSPRLLQLAGELRAEWRELDAREALNGEFVELAQKIMWLHGGSHPSLALAC